jgi:predicted dehydrogenase
MSQEDIASVTAYHWLHPEDPDEIRVCIIGAGKMARLHIGTLKGMAGVSIEGISSRSSASGQKLAAEFGIKKAYTDWEQMLRELKPDAVIVAVTHSVVFELYKKLLTYGIPCLLEKPAGYSVEQTTELVRLAEAHSCFNMVAVNRRFFNTVQQALLEVLHQGPLRGIVVETNDPIANYRSRLEFDKWVYDEWIYGNSIHAIDLFRMAAGEVKEVHAIGKSIMEPYGDHFSALIEFEDGTMGTFVAHYNSGGGFGIKLYGEGVSATLIPLEKGMLNYSTGRAIQLEGDALDQEYRAGLFAQNALFLRTAMAGTKLPFPASDLKDHLKTIRLIDMIRKKAVGV